MKTTGRLILQLFSLCVSQLAAAQSGTTLLVKTDAACKWKLDGQSMAPLKADESIVVLVTPGEHLLEAAATEGAATLRTSFKVEKTEKTVDIQLKGRHDQQAKMLPPEPLKKLTADEVAKYPTWTDPATGLMWTVKGNGSDVDWAQATAYCAKSQYAGYRGWRLPTNEELLAIYDLSITTKKTFADGVIRDIHVKGKLDIDGEVWSSSPRYAIGQPHEASWLFTFEDDPHHGVLPNPFLNFTHFNYDTRALCVRQAENLAQAQ